MYCGAVNLVRFPFSSTHKYCLKKTKINNIELRFRFVSHFLSFTKKQSSFNIDNYRLQGPLMSGHPDMEQNSEMVPYKRLICSKKAIAVNKIQKKKKKLLDIEKRTEY